MISAMAIALLGTTFFFTACDDKDEKDPPLIQNTTVAGSQVGPFTVTATILDDNGDLKSAELFYKKNDVATFTTVNMTKGESNVYSGIIPAQTQGDIIYYYIKAVNSVDLITYEPATAPATTSQFEVSGVDYSSIVLNEIWAGGPTDADKFIELYNKSTEAINITGIYFERNEEGKIGEITAETTLAAGAYYILGTKNNTTNPNDPNAPYENSVSKGFSAKKSIRFKMFSPSGNVIDMFLRGAEDNLDVTISDMAPKSYSRIPNGTGAWKVVTNATLRAANDATGAADIPNE